MRCGPRMNDAERAAFFDAIEAETLSFERQHQLTKKKDNSKMQAQTGKVETLKMGTFPFKLDNLKSWTLKRTDGTVTKFVLSSAALVETNKEIPRLPSSSSNASNRTTSGYGSYCAHTPTNVPLAEFDRGDDQLPLKLWVANMAGARATKDKFEFVIDAGDIISLYTGNYTNKLLEGDPELVKALGKFSVDVLQTRLLKIDWDDRQAPNVIPEFWTELNKMLYGDIMTCCVGGHGRSGTTFVCLLLNNAPDYDALDAIIHIRAVHCPRAIESMHQHEYINDVATFLKREANAKQASAITDYKAAFMASTKPTAIATRKMLGWDKDKK